MAENPPVFGSFGARKGRQKAVCPYMAIGNLPLLPDFLIQQAAGMFACFAPRLRPSPYTAFQQCKGFGFGNENISESCCNYIKCGHQENQSLDAHILSLQKKIQRFESELDDILLYRGTMQPP
jgi:hypothetical protein